MIDKYDAVAIAQQQSLLILAGEDMYNKISELGNDRDPTNILILTYFMDNSDWIVRMNALQALGEIRHPLARIAVRSTIQDADETVRETATTILGRIGDRSDIGRLLYATHDSDWAVRSAAVLGLGLLGGLKARRTLEILYTIERNKFVKRNIARGLGNIKSDKVIPFLEAALEDKPIGLIRLEILYALYKHGQHYRIEELLEMLKSTDFFVRINIVNGIEVERIRPEDVLKTELKLREHLDTEENEEVKEGTRELISLIQDNNKE